jgi:hypothetical protein
LLGDPYYTISYSGLVGLTTAGLYTATRSTIASKAEPRNAPDTAYSTAPLIVETSTNQQAMLEKLIEEIALVTLLLIKILRIETRGSITASRKAVKHPMSIRSSIGLSYYVFG